MFRKCMNMWLSIFSWPWFLGINLVKELWNFPFIYQTTGKFYFIWVIKSPHHYHKIHLLFTWVSIQSSDFLLCSFLLSKQPIDQVFFILLLQFYTSTFSDSKAIERWFWELREITKLTYHIRGTTKENLLSLIN